MAVGVSAWVIPTLTACIGGIIGGLVVHFVSTGRDRRKERNDARYPIWRWFKDNPPGNGTQLKEFEQNYEQELKKYEYQSPKSEWRKFNKHYNKINNLQKKVRSGGWDLSNMQRTTSVALSRPELDQVSMHWKAIIKLTRHRK